MNPSSPPPDPGAPPWRIGLRLLLILDDESFQELLRDDAKRDVALRRLRRGRLAFQVLFFLTLCLGMVELHGQGSLSGVSVLTISGQALLLVTTDDRIKLLLLAAERTRPVRHPEAGARR
jgi:hypothetical protein